MVFQGGLVERSRSYEGSSFAEKGRVQGEGDGKGEVSLGSKILYRKV